MQKIVLIGDAIAHSFSPRLHNYLFERFDLPYRYSLMPLKESRLAGAVEAMRHDKYRGANITSPYKQLVIPLLDEIAEEAVSIGAVNTIVIDKGRMIGYNTDAFGFARSLEGCRLIDSDFSAAVIGTGGAALAAVYSLLKMPRLESVFIYSRDKERARVAAARWNDPRVDGNALDQFRQVDLLVHATPVGLAGDSGSVLDGKQLHGVKLLYDMIYSPAETALMRSAASIGVMTIGGTRMFIYQALRAFQLWTGIEIQPSDLPDDILAAETAP